MNPSTPPQALQKRAGATIIPMGWPSYGSLQSAHESVRWQLYEFIKRLRVDLESRGCLFVEPYDAFVRRVCEELQL